VAEIMIGSEGTTAVVSTQGAALLRFTAGDTPVIGSDPPLPLDAYPGAVLAPWPNRLFGGVWEHQGIEYRVPINDPARNASLHGLVSFREWAVEDSTDASLMLGARLGDDPGYPFDVVLHARYSVRTHGITATIEAHNRERKAVPIGLGAHPYLAAFGGVDRARLNGRALHNVTLDDAVAVEERDGDGLANVIVEQPAGRARVWGGDACRYFMIFTADTLAEPWRRAALAVEPMTCPPDAFRTGDVDIVEPDDVLILEWGVEFTERSRS
jgi:aldose 1-epimerase